MLLKGQGWNSSAINKQHQDRKKGSDNKNFNTQPMARLLIRPLRSHTCVVIPNSTMLTWLLAALQCSVGYYLGPSRRETKLSHLLEATGRECVPPHSISTRRDSLGERSDSLAMLGQHCWIQWCYADVHLMPWQFVGISIKTTNQLLLRCDDSLQKAAASQAQRNDLEVKSSLTYFENSTALNCTIWDTIFMCSL